MIVRAGKLLSVLMAAVAAGGVSLLPGLPPLRAATVPEVSALVTGVDDYRHLSHLEGAAADARALAHVLEEVGVKRVHLLLDEEATAATVFAAWQEMLAATPPTGVMVFSFAGHGVNEGEARSLALALRGYRSPDKDDPGTPEDGSPHEQRLTWGDLQVLVRQAAPRSVLLLLDVGHSARSRRPVDPRVGRAGLRFAGREDAIVPVDSHFGTGSLAVLASSEGEAVPEVAGESGRHGLLSWSLVEALEGRGDTDADGRMTPAELVASLTESVRLASEGRQHPLWLSSGSPLPGLVLPVARRSRTAEDGWDGTGLPPALLLPLRVLNAPSGDPTLLLSRLTGVVAAESGDGAALVWDGRSGDVLTCHGDAVARISNPNSEKGRWQMQGVVEKWTLIARLIHRDESLPRIRLTWLPGEGEEKAPRVSVGPSRYPHRLAFLLDAYGRATVLPDIHGDALDIPDGKRGGIAHIVVLAADFPLSDLARDLAAQSGDGTADPAVLLERHLKGHHFQSGLLGLYPDSSTR